MKRKETEKKTNIVAGWFKTDIAKGTATEKQGQSNTEQYKQKGDRPSQ